MSGLFIVKFKEGIYMDFYKRVALVCSWIPEGTVASYGQIALLCGKPKNARQVGYALNRGLAGEEAPAHRVVNAAGVLSGAGAFDTPTKQKKLLEKEGIRVKRVEDGWQADMDKYGWKHSLDDALLLKARFEKEGI